MSDRAPHSDPDALAEVRRLALTFADADAEWGDYRSALRWLDTVGALDGILEPALAARQERWRAAQARSEAVQCGAAPLR